MTRYAELRALVQKWRSLGNANTYTEFHSGQASSWLRCADELEAALALPEDNVTVNAELYGLAIAMADYCARTDIEFASTKEFAEFIGLPGIELDKIMEAMQNANHYLSLREASGEPMPYKVVRDGDKVRFL